MKSAEVLGVNVRTMEDWLEKMIKHARIERVMKGQSIRPLSKSHNNNDRNNRKYRKRQIRDLREIRDV